MSRLSVVNIRSAFASNVLETNILQFHINSNVFNQSLQSWVFYQSRLLIHLDCNNFNVGLDYLMVFEFCYSRMMTWNPLNVFNFFRVSFVWFPFVFSNYESLIVRSRELPFDLHSSRESFSYLLRVFDSMVLQAHRPSVSRSFSIRVLRSSRSSNKSVFPERSSSTSQKTSSFPLVSRSRGPSARGPPIFKALQTGVFNFLEYSQRERIF
jgi:hypothetical protein